MNITIQKAKNEEETAVIDGHFLHSNYAPKKEAERFVENLKLPYQPSSIIITEAGLSYSAEFLRKKYPGIKIGVIRYTDFFNSYNSNFDFVLTYYDHPDFEAYLERQLNEEDLLTSFFTPWPASSQIFTETDNKVWNAIKASMLRAKTILITRQYFEKKWFLNSCTFIKNISSVISFTDRIEKDVLIISSGPSLLPFIKLIQENQNRYFIICLSSAISVCLKNGIMPDLCMSTDGGYWAGQHLKALYKNSIPLAMPPEAYCPNKLLSKLEILPLDYGDGPSSEILGQTKLPSLKALRNGTISGTALSFAAMYFTGSVYFAGLDMACRKGYQHSQPNQLEFNSCLNDNRIKNKATRLSRSELTNGSLDIYRDWFINNPVKDGQRNFYRLINPEDRNNNLGWIKDIDTKTFFDLIKDNKNCKAFTYKLQPKQADTDEILKLLSDSKACEKWKRQFFPLDYIQLSHNPSNTEVNDKIEKEWKQLKEKAEKILK